MQKKIIYFSKDTDRNQNEELQRVVWEKREQALLDGNCYLYIYYVLIYMLNKRQYITIDYTCIEYSKSANIHLCNIHM